MGAALESNVAHQTMDRNSPDFIKQEKTFILYVSPSKHQTLSNAKPSKEGKNNNNKRHQWTRPRFLFPFAICSFRFVMKKTCRRCSRQCLEYIADSPSSLPKSSRRCKDVLCCGDAELCSFRDGVHVRICHARSWWWVVHCRFSFGEGMRKGLVVAGFAQRVAEPFQPLVQPVSRGGAGGLDVLNSIISQCTSQTRPYKVHIEEGSIHTQARCLKLCNPNLSVISAAFMAFGKSCLLAKTNNNASRSSSSLSMRCSSSRASTTRSRSLLSTTKMMPCVFWK